MSTATAIDPQQLVQQAIKKITAIATLPEITSKIIEIVEDPKSTAAELHKIVSHDPALVTRILKVVNSAFYGLPGQIGSIERGIVLLGLNAVKNIAVAASLGQLFRSHVLQEITGGTGVECSPQISCTSKGCEYDDSRVQAPALEFGSDIKAAHFRHFDISQKDVGFVCEHCFECVGSVT